MRTAVGYNVCLPPEYRSNTQQRFPIIYYLHGYKGDESSYLDYAEHWRTGLRATGPCLLVFVNGGDTSFFSDAPDGSVMGEAVIKELIPHIDAQFRTIPEPAKRSLHGYSMGGFGALKLAFKYPDLFGSAVAYGATLFSAGEMQKEAGKLYRTMFGSRDRFDANNPLSLLKANAEKLRGRVSVAVVIGTKDEFLRQNRELAQALEATKVRHEFLELPGVKHDKDPIYEKGAQRAFEFTGKMFREGSGER
jgi:endo-1,4-beta-xylanase